MKVGKPQTSFALTVAVLVFVAAATSLRGEEPGAASISGLDDYAGFAACLLGPEVDAGAGCTSSDLDFDGDVDLADASRMQLMFGLSIPSGMAFIPAGTFQMGDTFNEGYSSELPVHSVYLDAYYMDKYEVTKSLWDSVRGWAVAQGYDLIAGSGKAPDHPVQTVNWYDCVKWCNARSQQEGRTPCYYTNAGLTTVYKSGEVAPYVKWDANGYRLPTEAEWEKAARGGSSGHRFPWSDTDTIQHARANYYSSSSLSYDTSPTRGFHPAFATGDYPYTSPVGYFAPNAYGLFDMAGNVLDWCHDWSSDTYYSVSPGSIPTGPASGTYRVLRGGFWDRSPSYCRSAARLGGRPNNRLNSRGFRCVLGTP